MHPAKGQPSIHRIKGSALSDLVVKDRPSSCQNTHAADGMEALYRGPRTTKPQPGHKIHPYLLGGIEITRPNKVWAPHPDGARLRLSGCRAWLSCLTRSSRRVLSWRASITTEAAFRVETLEDALAHHEKLEFFNADQGSQFTGPGVTDVLIRNKIAISIDGKAAWRDNVFVERL